MRYLFAVASILCGFFEVFAQGLGDEGPYVGYTELRTNLPGGRHANVKTMRAALVRARDGSGRKLIGQDLAKPLDTWTQFAGWSPDGQTAILGVGWQSPENAKWEEENKQFRMGEGQWKLDTCLVELKNEKVFNITAVDRVSHYNGGLFYLPDGKGFGFTPLIKGISKPFLMDLDGKNKRDVSGSSGGFAYGYSASPDGKSICYHENYQIFLSAADGSGKKQIVTGNPFNFAPKWSPDGNWLLFVSGEHYNCHPHIVKADGTGLKKLADRGGYRGVIEFLDVPDFHGGSSDTPIWSMEGKSVIYTSKVDSSVELFEATLDGKSKQLTRSTPNSWHYHPQLSPDGKWLLYGSMRDGARNLYVMNREDGTQKALTNFKPGFGAMWPHWQPTSSKTPIQVRDEKESSSKKGNQKTRRVLYNFDGDSCLFTKANGKGPVAVNLDDVKRLIEEVAFDGSRVDTVLVCINAQVMYYPTKVGTMRGSASTAEERAKWPESEKQRFANLKSFFDQGVDPYQLILNESRRRGREALLTFRMNDNHGNDFLRTKFFEEHPAWRLGKGALDFGHQEVRDYVASLIEEAISRYDCDGLELDFNRFPTFFQSGTPEEHVAKMDSLVLRIRRHLDRMGQERGRRLILSVRPPSNYGRKPPTPESARLLGCDVAGWAQKGLVDFIAVSEFLFERGDLPIETWKKAIPTVPVYGGIECTTGGGKKNLTANEYKVAAQNLIKKGADGVYLFNFFTSREEGAKAYEPPFEVLGILGK